MGTTMPSCELSKNKVEQLLNHFLSVSLRSARLIPGETSMFEANRARKKSPRRIGGMADHTDFAIAFINRVEKRRVKNRMAKRTRLAQRRANKIHKRIRRRQRGKGQR